MTDAERLAAAMPENVHKAGEHGLAAGRSPQPGAHATGIEGEDAATASTVTEGTAVRSPPTRACRCRTARTA